MNTFTVANTLEPVTTFEGLRILPDYDYTQEGLPTIDILVVPSAEHHLDTDLEDAQLLEFVQKVDAKGTFRHQPLRRCICLGKGRIAR